MVLTNGAGCGYCVVTTTFGYGCYQGCGGLRSRDHSSDLVNCCGCGLFAKK